MNEVRIIGGVLHQIWIGQYRYTKTVKDLMLEIIITNYYSDMNVQDFKIKNYVTLNLNKEERSHMV